MNPLKRILASLALVFGFASAGLALTETEKDDYVLRVRDAADQPVRTGVWHASLDKCRAYADANNLPLVAVWSNKGCGHCKSLNLIIGTDSFTNRIAQTGIVFCYIKSTDAKGTQNGTWYNWVFKQGVQTQFPLVRFYWNQFKNPSDSSHYTVGDSLRGVKTGTTGENNVYNNILAAFPGFDPTTYSGGSFAVGNLPGARLEAQIGSTTNVAIPFLRDQSVANVAATNSLKVAFQSGTAIVTREFQFTWDVGQTNQSVNLPLAWGTDADNSTLSIPPFLVYRVVQAESTIDLTLLDDEGKTVEESAITLVDIPNSSSNPLWIGERTAETLQAGEWTMDLEVAKARTAAQAGKAYTLAMVTGSLWCPNCKGADDSLLASDEFKAWAVENNVALVQIDTSRVDSSRRPWKPVPLPTLLRPGVTNGVSGLGYLTRKMADLDQAEQIAQRNVELTYKTWLVDNSTKDRLANPTFLLLRKDGTVAGRLNPLENSDKTFPVANNIARLNDLLLLADEADEEANSYLQTTTATASFSKSAEGSVNINDAADYFKLDNVTVGINYEIGASTLSTNTPVTRTVVQVSGGVQTTLASGGGNGPLPFSPTAADADYYLIVKPDTDKLNQAIGAGEGSTVAYNFPLEVGVVTPPETKGSIELDPAGLNNLRIHIEDGQRYRFAFLDGLDVHWYIPDWLDLNHDELDPEFYIANGTGEFSLFANAKGTLVFQLWKPGQIELGAVPGKVAENAGSFTIPFIRTGGLSGTVKATLAYDGAAVTNSRIEKVEPLELTWTEGETITNLVTVTLRNDLIYVGEDELSFSLALEESLTQNKVNPFSVVITEDDQPIVGKLRFAETDLYAREETDLSIGVDRIDGASTAVSTAFKLDYGTIAPATLAWDNNDRVHLKSATLSLPSLKDCPRALVTATLVPAGIQAARGGNKLTVHLIAADAPAFEADAVAIAKTQYEALNESIALKDTQGGTITLRKLSGALPSGVKFAYDSKSGEAVLSGAATKAGDYLSVWQVSERRGRATVPGMTLRLILSIKEIAEVNPSLSASTLTIAGGYAVREADGLFATSILEGTISKLQIAKTGKVSLSYINAGGATTLRSTAWAAISESGTCTAELSDRDGTTATIAIDAAGKVTGRVSAYDTDGVFCDLVFPSRTWTKSGEGSAEAFAGYYTVALVPEYEEDDEEGGEITILEGEATVPPENQSGAALRPTGPGYLTLKMNTTSAIRSGKVTYSGVLPNGTVISGTSTLIPTEDDGWALLPVMKVSSKERFSVLLKIRANAAEDYHDDPKVVLGETGALWAIDTGYESLDYTLIFSAYGNYYDPKANLQVCCDQTTGTTNLFANIEFESLLNTPAESFGAPTAETLTAEAQKVTVSPSKIALAGGQANPLGLRLSFNKATGVFSGSFTIEGEQKSVKATFKGVVIVGWLEDCGACNPEGELGISIPFGTGAFWVNDSVNPAENPKRRVTIKRGGCILLEGEPVESEL